MLDKEEIPEEEGLEEEVEEQEGLEEEWVDPGSLEGVAKKDPIKEQDNIKETHPKYQKIYGKLKEAERQLETFKGSLAERDAILKEMKDWNQKLAEVVEKASKEDDEEEEEDPTPAIKEEIISLQAQYAKALKGDEYEEATKILDKITDLKLDLRQYKENKVSKKEAKKKEKEEKKEEKKEDKKGDDEIPLEVRKFFEIKWFKEEPEMRAYAKMLDKELEHDAKWAKEPLSKRLIEVQKRVEQRFNWNQNPNRRVRGVEEEGTFNKGSKTFTLDEVERNIAAGFGLTEAQILKQKQIIAREQKRGRKS